MTPVVRTERLTKRYGHTTALRDLDLTENEILLATFIGLMVATWALGTLIHTKVLPASRHLGTTPGHT